MALFKYVAKDLSSKRVTGKMEAADHNELIRVLKTQNLFLVSSTTEKRKDNNEYRFKLLELSDFSREIGTMLASGVTLIRTISIMEQRTQNKKIKRIYQDMYQKLQQGLPLSRAMAAQGVAFPRLLIEMFRASETSGSMDKTALLMAEQYKKDHQLTQKTKSAMTYPVILMVVTVAVLIIVFAFVMPRFLDLFQDMELPLITRINFAISGFLINYWYLLILVVGLSIASILVLLQNPKVKIEVDKLKFKLPVFGRLFSIIYTARFSRTLASLYTAGISIVECLEIARTTTGNTYLESQFVEAIRGVRSGEALSVALSHIDGFDYKLITSVYIGEESGKLDHMLQSLADNFEYDATQASERLVTLIEPIMIIFLAVVVCMIIVSVMLPIYGVYNNISNM
ncbi:MAG: type II secretion system F family protein [Erysipelotrichaceae bacterium]|nr:type II secretion system F family protein [Erysipelotrichaceae bacterium]